MLNASGMLTLAQIAAVVLRGRDSVTAETLLKVVTL
jgi:hypothetical protein